MPKALFVRAFGSIFASSLQDTWAHANVPLRLVLSIGEQQKVNRQGYIRIITLFREEGRERIKRLIGKREWRVCG